MKKLITTLLILVCFSGITNAITFSWSGFVPIFDNQTDTIPIVVSGLPSSMDTTFGINHICMNITHTYKADLYIRMVSPTGTSILLIQNIGGSSDNFAGTCLGMDGTPFSNSQPPYVGLFVPVGNIAAFNNGQNPNGTWLFIVSDVAGGDSGSIHTVSIDFIANPARQTTPVYTSVPTGTYLCATCTCPGSATDCDLLPDMTSSAQEISTNHTETPGFLDVSNATPNIGP